jgi:hypothetical protein
VISILVVIVLASIAILNVLIGLHNDLIRRCDHAYHLWEYNKFTRKDLKIGLTRCRRHLCNIEKILRITNDKAIDEYRNRIMAKLSSMPHAERLAEAVSDYCVLHPGKIDLSDMKPDEPYLWEDGYRMDEYYLAFGEEKRARERQSKERERENEA